MIASIVGDDSVGVETHHGEQDDAAQLTRTDADESPRLAVAIMSVMCPLQFVSARIFACDSELPTPMP